MRFAWCIILLTMMAQFDVGPLYGKTLRSEAKVKVHEGGSSSGKTVSLLQYWATASFEESNALYSVTRDTFPNLRRGPIYDWKNILAWAGYTDLFSENKTTHTWTNLKTGTRIEFLALDDEQKARGPRRNRLFMNEAQEIPLDTAKQLMRRTSDEILIDYNPSLIHWWIDTEIIPRDDAEVFYSTYKDNPFLSKDIIQEIENDVPTYQEGDKLIKDWDLTYNGTGVLVKGDPYEWAVYGLGRRGSPSEAVYPFVEEGPFPSDAEYVRGLDFGYEHPMVLLDVALVDAEKPRAHFRQQIFASNLTISDLIREMDQMRLDKRVLIYADSSRPEAIAEIRAAGYNIEATKKGAGSVVEGIDYVKRHTLVFEKGAEQSMRQFQNYRRKKIAGIIQDEPVKKDDDAPDAGRYALFEHWGRNKGTFGLWG